MPFTSFLNMCSLKHAPSGSFRCVYGFKQVFKLQVSLLTEHNVRADGAEIAGVEEGEPQTGVELVEAKEAAFKEAEDFQVGDPIIASAELVITTESPDPEVVEIATDPDVVAEEANVASCCPEGSFCCGLELGCLPDALAPDVMCPVLGPDSPIPCCTRRLF